MGYVGILLEYTKSHIISADGATRFWGFGFRASGFLAGFGTHSCIKRLVPGGWQMIAGYTKRLAVGVKAIYWGGFTYMYVYKV